MGNDFGLSENAVKQFNDLYCLKDESISDAFNRVASDLSDNDDYVMVEDNVKTIAMTYSLHDLYQKFIDDYF